MAGDLHKIGDENRAGARRRMLKAGLIAWSNRFITHNCTVRDFSDTGARLRVDDVAQIPDSFDLLIELDGLEVACEVVWRRPGEIGVRFTAEPVRKPPTRAQVVSAVRPAVKPSLRRKV